MRLSFYYLYYQAMLQHNRLSVVEQIDGKLSQNIKWPLLNPVTH